MPVHSCPVCGTTHEVHPILHELAYGRQLTCSPRCKTDFRKFAMSLILAEAAGKAAPATEHEADEKELC